MAKLQAVKDALEARTRPPEKTIEDVLGAIGGLDLRPNITTQQVDLEPLLSDIGKLKVLLSELKAMPEPEKVNLAPILDAVAGVNLDLTPVIRAIESVKPAPRPTKWKLIHHRDRMGRIIETEAIADGSD